MRAFEVHLNNKLLCVAGIGNNGVLTAIVDSLIQPGQDDAHLTVGGLLTPRNEHVTWKVSRLQTGDEILIRIVDAKSIDKPKKRYRRDAAADLRSKKRYVRAMAKEFGWQITTSSRKLKSK